MTERRIALGKTFATKGVSALFDYIEMSVFLARHSVGDWGDVSDEDWEINDSAYEFVNGRLFSAYKTFKGKVWVITEHDRSSTTILLPEEY